MTLSLAGFIVLSHCGPSAEDNLQPGRQSDGSILLSSGRRLTPAGESTPLGTFPLGIAVSPDGAYAAVTCTGPPDAAVSIIDLERFREKERIPLKGAWLGICFSPDGRRLFASGGSSDEIEVFTFSGGSARHERTIGLGSVRGNRRFFPASLACSPDGRFLVSANLLDNSIGIIDLSQLPPPLIVPVGDMPYGVAFHPGGGKVYVSNWGGGSVSDVTLEERAETARIAVGSHPNALLFSPDGKHLYVSNGNSDSVTIIDARRNTVVETVDLSPFPGAPAGVQPNALAVAGTTLFTANAGTNSLAVVDVSRQPAVVRGYIPTGLYPTAVATTHDNTSVLVVSGKGSGVYVSGDSSGGSLSRIKIPGGEELASSTARVMQNNGFDRMPGTLEYGITFREPRAIPEKTGETSLLKYVFYIIKGNLHYDEVFGDNSGQGGENSAAANHRALARQFVQFDNFYVRGDSYAEGLEWATSGVATGVVTKLVPAGLFSGGGAALPEDAVHPGAGSLLDAAADAGITFRIFGDASGITLTDSARARKFAGEFAVMAADGSLPVLTVVYLPGKEGGVAENDRALGKIVETVTNSPVWGESVIFVVESFRGSLRHDEAYRSVALVVSPYARHGFTDHTLYDTSSIVRSIELILGISPLSLFDAGAQPLYNAFTNEAVLEPFHAVR